MELDKMTDKELIQAYIDHEVFLSYGHFGNSDWDYRYNLLTRIKNRNLELTEEIEKRINDKRTTRKEI